MTTEYDARPMSEILAEQKNKYLVTKDPELDELLSKMNPSQYTYWSNVVYRMTRGLYRKWQRGIISGEEWDAKYHEQELINARRMVGVKE